MSTASEKKTITIHVRLEESIVKTLERVAKEEDRKVSNLAARILKQWVEAREREK